MPNFGPQTGRPGGEPPPRRQLTPEEIAVRENFDRARHLAGNPPSAPEAAQVREVKAFDEAAIRAALQQEGLDFTFQIFPKGEKPPESAASNQRLVARVAELESERTVMRNRMIVAEQAAATAIQEVRTITTQRDTLQTELESLKSEKAPPRKSKAQEAV